MDMNEPVVNQPSESQLPVQPPVVTPVIPVNPEPPKKSRSNMPVIIGVIVLALLILAGVTFMALSNSSSDKTAALPSSAPTPVVTASPVSDSASAIQADLDQTTITDPGTDVDQLSSDLNQL